MIFIFLVSLSHSEVLVNLQSTDVSPQQSCGTADGEGEGVPDGPVEEQRAAVGVPVCCRVNDGGEHDGLAGHGDGPHQGDQQLQPGHRGGQADCQDVYHGPEQTNIIDAAMYKMALKEASLWCLYANI